MEVWGYARAMANGLREGAPDDRLRDAIRNGIAKVDCFVASRKLSAGRPCERRDPSPLTSKAKKGLCCVAQKENPRRMGPCVRRDDSLERGGIRKFHMRLPYRHGVAISRRDAPESCKKSLAPMRAWGMPGARCTRSLVCKVLVAHKCSHHRFTGTPGIPARGWF
jgi:hypothetical protein